MSSLKNFLNIFNSFKYIILRILDLPCFAGLVLPPCADDHDDHVRIRSESHHLY